MISINKTLHTSGDGFWSDVAKAVQIVGFSLSYAADDDEDFGELCVHFDNSWNVETHGLIYTDTVFMRELCEMLDAEGLDSTDVSYSEQGMQGDDYVSCDAGPQFIASYKAKYAVAA